MTAGEVVWAASHGHVLIELSGYFEGVQRDPIPTFEDHLRRCALGFGDDAELVERVPQGGPSTGQGGPHPKLEHVLVSC